MSEISSYRSIENKHNYNSKKEKMKFLTKEQQESYKNAKTYICKEIYLKIYNGNIKKIS